MTRMDRRAARAVLGVPADAPWPDVRARYRTLVRRHHPDVAAAHDAGATTALLTAAYRVLRQAHAEGLQPEPASPPPLRRTSSHAPSPAAPPIDADGALVLDAPPDDAFFALLEAAHALGEVAYRDLDAGLLETIVEFDGLPAASVLCTLQGRAAGTEVFVTIEPLGATEAPAVDDVVAALRALLGGPPPAG